MPACARGAGICQDLCGLCDSPARRRRGCDFFYESYKDTPREKALEWLAGAPDYERLKTLTQKDLAITLCDRRALGTISKDNIKQAS